MKWFGEDGYSMGPDLPVPPPPVRSAVERDWREVGGILGRLNPHVVAERIAREREELCPSWMAL